MLPLRISKLSRSSAFIPYYWLRSSVFRHKIEKRLSAFIPKYLIRIVCFHPQDRPLLVKKSFAFIPQNRLLSSGSSAFDWTPLSDFSPNFPTSFFLILCRTFQLLFFQLPFPTTRISLAHRKGVRLVRLFYKNELSALFKQFELSALFVILEKLVLAVEQCVGIEQCERANNEHVCSQFGEPWYMYASFCFRK